jgi:hypothetical protein
MVQGKEKSEHVYQMLRMENRIEKQREEVEEKSCFSCILH